MSIGYDQLSKNAYQLLAVPMFEATGAVSVKDIAKPHHVTTQTNSPTWTQLASGLWVLDFDSAIPEFLEIAAAASADLDFTSGDFSLVWWMNPDAIALYRLFCRGLLDTDGYFISLLATGAISVTTNQAAASQVTESAASMAVAGTYAYWGVSRSGSSIRIFRNGRDVTSVVGAHTNPLTAARKFLTGIYDDEASNPVDGKLWNPRVLSGISLSEYTHRLFFEMERKWFRV